MRIQANPQTLAGLGLSLDDVRTAIVAANVNQAKGSFDGAQRASTIDANDQLKSAAEYQNLVIAWQERQPAAAEGRGATSSTTPRTCAWPPGPTARPASSSTCSASPAPT